MSFQFETSHPVEPCANCQPWNLPTTIWCESCKTSFCDTCSTQIHGLQVFQNHQLFPIDKRPWYDSYCTEHEDEKIKYWCQDDQALLCSDCILFQHKDHRYARIADLAKTISYDFEIKMSNAKAAFQNYVGNLKPYISNKNQIQSQLKIIFDRLRMDLQEQEQRIYEDIERIESNNELLISEFNISLNLIERSLFDLSLQFDGNKNSSYPVFVIKSNQSVIDQIDQLQTMIYSLKLPGILTYSIDQIEKNQKSITDQLKETSITKNVDIDVIDGFLDLRPILNWSEKGVVLVENLDAPFALSIDHEDGTLFIVDHGNHRILAQTPGEPQARIIVGGQGPGNGLNQLHYPTDVHVDKKTNSIFIADCGNRRILRWSLLLDFGQEIITDIDCFGIAMDRDGLLYVVDTKTSQVKRFSIDDPTTSVVVCGTKKGGKLNRLRKPRFVALDREGSIYISDHGNHRVVKWLPGATEGELVAGALGRGSNMNQLIRPNQITIDFDGSLYVADTMNHRILRYVRGSTEGEIVIDQRRSEENINSSIMPVGICFNRHGHLFVSEHKRNQVQRFLLNH